jgi:hypothetical protein
VQIFLSFLWHARRTEISSSDGSESEEDGLLVRRVVSYKLTNVSEVLITIITTLMMEAVSTFETSVNLYDTTRSSTPEDCDFRAHIMSFRTKCYTS